MTVNEKPNIIRVHYRKMRARLHHCHHEGFDKVAADMHLESGEALKSKIEGMLNYYTNLNPEKAQNLWRQFDEAVAAHG